MIFKNRISYEALPSNVSFLFKVIMNWLNLSTLPTEKIALKHAWHYLFRRMNQGCCSTECHIRNKEAGWSTEKPSHLPTDLRLD